MSKINFIRYEYHRHIVVIDTTDGTHYVTPETYGLISGMSYSQVMSRIRDLKAGPIKITKTLGAKDKSVSTEYLISEDLVASWLPHDNEHAAENLSAMSARTYLVKSVEYSTNPLD